jgi:hypothetical protein
MGQVRSEVQRHAGRWIVRESNPGGGEISTPVYIDTEAHKTTYSMEIGPLTGIKRRERFVDNPPSSSIKVKEWEELLLVWDHVICSGANFIEFGLNHLQSH